MLRPISREVKYILYDTTGTVVVVGDATALVMVNIR